MSAVHTGFSFSRKKYVSGGFDLGLNLFLLIPSSKRTSCHCPLRRARFVRRGQGSALGLQAGWAGVGRALPRGHLHFLPKLHAHLLFSLPRALCPLPRRKGPALLLPACRVSLRPGTSPTSPGPHRVLRELGCWDSGLLVQFLPLTPRVMAVLVPQVALSPGWLCL